jgi:hypothetical protein
MKIPRPAAAANTIDLIVPSIDPKPISSRLADTSAIALLVIVSRNSNFSFVLCFDHCPLVLERKDGV